MVASLMAAERVPQNQLRDQKSILSRQQSAFSDLKSAYSKVSDRLDTLKTADTWQRRTATSSDTKVAATVNSDAAIGQFTFTVDQTAAAHAVYTADTVAADDIVSDTGTYAGMTATEAVTAINNDDTLDTTAALIQTAPGGTAFNFQQKTLDLTHLSVLTHQSSIIPPVSPLSPPVETPKSACPAITRSSSHQIPTRSMT